MKRWSDRTLARVADLSAAIAEAPRRDQSRARAALEGLSGLIPFDCAVVCRADGRSLSLAAAIGHRDGVESAVGREEYRLEQIALGMDLSSAPLRFRDLPDGGRSSRHHGDRGSDQTGHGLTTGYAKSLGRLLEHGARWC